MHDGHQIVSVEDYEQYVGAETIDRIMKKAKPLQDLHTVHVNSTYYGGGVAEILSSLVLLFNSVGIKTGWRIIQGSPDFFSITKKVHNALQGGEINLSELKREIYEVAIQENAIRNHLDHDMVIIHDPQPLAMIEHFRKRGPWIWRCHIDMSDPHAELWHYLVHYVEQYDGVILSLKEYKRKLKTPQIFFQPAIDVFTIKNKELTDDEIQERLDHYDIPTDLPIVAQISRFDPWKDPKGVIEAFQIARKQVDATLVLVGNVATDDPEGHEVYESLLDCREDRIIILSFQDSALVNALQRKADVIIQKSIKEGFGLTVAEAMWKGTAVIGGNVGGIRHQITDGENGFLVSSVQETADRIVQLLKDRELRERIGHAARENVRKRYLMTRLLEQYLDLYNSYETAYKIRRKSIIFHK
ncbi:glycosyltransferase [candidate division KSB1 bacterium]|nr:glycosyltransferase [candidate division KSB1 bacterium]